MIEETDPISSFKRDIKTLATTQECFMTLKALLDKKNDVSDELSDVWNVMIELREVLLDKIVKSPIMKVAGGADALKRVVS